MPIDREQLKTAIRARVVELAKVLGMDASDLADDDIIPASGYLDSAAILELVVWYEGHCGIRLAQEEINIDNLGSVNAMADYAIGKAT
jgi:acyl carrier protein